MDWRLADQAVEVKAAEGTGNMRGIIQLRRISVAFEMVWKSLIILIGINRSRRDIAEHLEVLNLRLVISFSK